MYTQYELPYDYNALEPVIDALTVEMHHDRHHATYTENLNKNAQKAGVADRPIEELLSDLDSIESASLRTAIRNNGGGFYNHNLYFSILSPKPVKEPSGRLALQIREQFGSFEDLKEELKKTAAGQFGSGWAWLSADKEGKLYVSSSANQDNPLMEEGHHMPIFTLDVWEHAYYLKYKNLRGEYIRAFFDIVDWSKVSELYEKACG